MLDIDINTLRGISTILVMIGFTGVCVWAYSSKRHDEFEQAARMPLAEDDEVKP